MSSNPKEHRYSSQVKSGESTAMSTSNHWATPEALRRYQSWLKSEGLTQKNIGQGKILEENAYQNNAKLNYFFEQVKAEGRRYVDVVKTRGGDV